jgi:hypothetical protein
MFYGSSTALSIDDDYKKSRESLSKLSSSRISSMAMPRDVKLMLESDEERIRHCLNKNRDPFYPNIVKKAK